MGTLLQDTSKELPWLEAATGAIHAALAAHLSTGGNAGARIINLMLYLKAQSP